MSAFKFNKRIRFERSGGTDPEYGTQNQDGWVPFCERWAEVQDVTPSKSEAVTNGLRVARDATRVRIRYRADITADMRIVELSGRKRILQIVGGPAEIAGGREIEILAEAYSS